MPELDLFELTGLSFDPPEKNAKKVAAALDRVKRELEGQLGNVTQIAERNAISEKLGSIRALRAALFTPDGRISAKMAELAQQKTSQMTQRLEQLLRFQQQAGMELLFSRSAELLAFSRKFHLSFTTVEQVCRDCGATVTSDDPKAALPKFPVNADKICRELAELRASHDPASNSPDPRKVEDLYDFAAYLSGSPEAGPAFRGLPTQALYLIFDDFVKKNAARSDDLGKLCVSLATAAKTTVFDSDEHRSAYADYLRFHEPEMEQLFQVMRDASTRDLFCPAFYQHALEIIRRRFPDPATANAIYHKAAGLIQTPFLP